MHLFIHLIYFSSRPSILTVFSVFQIFFLFKHLYRFRDNLIWPRRPSPEQRPPHRDVDASFSHSLSLFLFSLPSLSETFIFPPHFHPWHTFPRPYQMSAELNWAHLSPTQTLRRWSRFTWRCVRAWGGLWWWPAGCCEPTLPACCDSSGFYQTGYSTPEPLMPREMRRSTPYAAWTETAGGSTPAMSLMRPEQANAPSRLQVKRAHHFSLFSWNYRVPPAPFATLTFYSYREIVFHWYESSFWLQNITQPCLTWTNTTDWVYALLFVFSVFFIFNVTKKKLLGWWLTDVVWWKSRRLG